MLKRLWQWLFGPPPPDPLMDLVRDLLAQQSARDAQFAANATAQTELLREWLGMFRPQAPTKGWVNDDRNMAIREKLDEAAKAESLEPRLTEVERVNQLARMIDAGF